MYGSSYWRIGVSFVVLVVAVVVAQSVMFSYQMARAGRARCARRMRWLLPSPPRPGVP